LTTQCGLFFVIDLEADRYSLLLGNTGRFALYDLQASTDSSGHEIKISAQYRDDDYFNYEPTVDTDSWNVAPRRRIM
jgi:hypothetical protein